MRRRGGALAALVAASLVASQASAPAQDGPATGRPVAAAVDSRVYALVLKDGAPYIDLRMGASSGLFLVDTGANTSGVDRAWLEESGAGWRPGRTTTVGGTTGAVRVDTCVLERLDLGAGFFRDAGFTLQSYAHFSPPVPGRPQAGLLGTDFLARYQLAFDWPNARLELRLGHERLPPPPGHEAVACAWPINLPTVGVRVGGLGLPCRLDTGATYLTRDPRLDVNPAAVEALRARGATLLPAGHITVRGVSGAERLELLRGAGEDGLVLELGPARVEHVVLVVHPSGTLASRPYPLALAGATLLARFHRLVFDPFDHLLWVPIPEPRHGPRLGPV